jgi:hypothetical protein
MERVTLELSQPPHLQLSRAYMHERLQMKQSELSALCDGIVHSPVEIWVSHGVGTARVRSAQVDIEKARQSEHGRRLCFVHKMLLPLVVT